MGSNFSCSKEGANEEVEELAVSPAGDENSGEEKPVPLRLYGAVCNGNTHKGKMVCALTGSEWEFHEVQLPIEDEAFRKLNPLGMVPVLVDSAAELDEHSLAAFADPEVLEKFGPPGLIVRDISAILSYVALRAGGEQWLPVSDPAAVAKVQQWMAYSISEVNTSLLWVRLHQLFGWEIPIPLEDAHERCRKVLGYLEKELSAAKVARRRFLASSMHPTIADIAMFPYVACIEESSLGEIRLGKYPQVAAWVGRLKALPGCPAMDKI